MAYRDEKEEKPAPIVHQWHLLPKLPTVTWHLMEKVFFTCVSILMVAGTLALCVWVGGYLYDWRTGRH